MSPISKLIIGKERSISLVAIQGIMRYCCINGSRHLTVIKKKRRNNDIKMGVSSKTREVGGPSALIEKGVKCFSCKMKCYMKSSYSKYKNWLEKQGQRMLVTLWLSSVVNPIILKPHVVLGGLIVSQTIGSKVS